MFRLYWLSCIMHPVIYTGLSRSSQGVIWGEQIKAKNKKRQREEKKLL